MIFNIITIFPEIFSSYFGESIIKRAIFNEKIKINIINLRDYTEDKHKTVDDTPYGGGAGMLMKVEPLYKALQGVKSQITNNKKQINSKSQISNSKVVLLSAKGKTWSQKKVREHANLDELTLICGRYEGVDERIMNFVDEEISIGDYVLTGGEIPAMAIVDSITRLLAGVLGNDESSISESHSEEGILEYPQYTRPEIFVDAKGKKHKVPEILLSGNHGEIEKWREGMKKRK